MMSEKELSKIEKKQKLNFFEKRAVKAMLKKARKGIEKYKQKVELAVEDRKLLEKEVLSLLDILEIEDDNGNSLTKDNIKNFSNKELEETLETSLNEMEKLL